MPDAHGKAGVMPTATLEEYLEAIYKLSQRGPVRPMQIAEVIGVRAPTVTATLQRLEARDLISRDGTTVVLTAQGTSQALSIVRRHRIAERFLVDALGLDWEAAHEDACLLEHALSPRVLDALERFLENPAVCPHGHPIPSADGTVADVVGVPLASIPPGRSATIVQVAEDDEVGLAYMGSIGLYPGTTVTVKDSAPNAGPLLVDAGAGPVALARDVAESILVTGEGDTH